MARVIFNWCTQQDKKDENQRNSELIGMLGRMQVMPAEAVAKLSDSLMGLDQIVDEASLDKVQWMNVPTEAEQYKATLSKIMGDIEAGQENANS